MIRLIVLMTLLCACITSTQIFLKFGLMKVHGLSLSIGALINIIKNLYIWAACVFMGTGALIWFYVINNYKLSLAFPLSSFSYIFVLLASRVFFNENVTFWQWSGVLLIMTGIFLITYTQR